VSWAEAGSVLALFAGWVVLTRWVLPRLGVPT